MTSRRETTTRSPSDVLIEHLGLTRRTQAEVEDLYSRPLRERRLSGPGPWTGVQGQGVPV